MMSEPTTRHVPITLEDVTVQFPFQPYETQKDYMRSVIQAVNTNSNALLESPTGTGKTLSLICSTLGWLSSSQNGKAKKAIIYYTSRTHTQLAQVAKEQKRTAYARMTSVVLGSRSQTCLNNEVRNQGADHLINRACRNSITKNACQYYSNYEQKLETLDMNQVLDIESLGEWGRGHQCCPYYAGKKVAEIKASLIMMPYNYLFDPSLSKGFPLKLENSVIIIDEAHNVDSVLKDAVSGKFTKNCLKIIQDSCKDLPAKLADALNKELHGLSRYGYDPKEKRTGSGNLFSKKSKSKEKESDKEQKTNLIEELAEKLTTERLQQIINCVRILEQETLQELDIEKINNIEKVFRLLNSAKIEYTTSDLILTTLDSMISFWSVAGVMNPTLVAKYVTATANFYHFISLIYPEQCLSVTRQQEHVKKLKEFYVAFLDGTYERGNVVRDYKGELKDWALNIWCLHPAIGLKRAIETNALNGPRSIILTSGTLSPMESIPKELDTNFKIMRQFKHVIEMNQMKAMIIGESSDSYRLLSDFESTEKDDYKKAIGKTLLALFTILPYGTLVIFSSYALLDKVMKYWKEKSNLWKDMNSCTSIFVESKTQESFLLEMKNYKRKLETKNSRAVFFGVCRGKLSEGVNLNGNQCRTVILTGLPFPSSQDPKVVSTREFHGRRYTDGNRIWYVQQMTRAMNQTVGRVIRSKDDYGMLILCDPRFTKYRYQLSDWARPFVPTNYTKICDVENEIKKFFELNGQKITGSVSESAGAFEIGFSKTLPDKQKNVFSKTNHGDFDNKTQNKLVHIRPLTQNTNKRKKVDTSTLNTSTVLSGITSDCDIIATYESHDGSINKSAKKSDLSILEQYKNVATNYKCFLCQGEAKNPHRTNCNCARIVCFPCMAVFKTKNITCQKCRIELRVKDFKQCLFKSAYRTNERFPPF